ncbi:MAG TPA: metal ABC transporter substrate-binding protein [Haliangium sp.]|nr:metal ABC transporter substrate-binding protein [Haliangium sp.]
MYRHLASISLFLGLLAPLSVSTPAHADLTVVATVPDLAALGREIGGPHAKVSALSLATQDPHFVDARPSSTLELNRADLLLAVGMDLEVGWLPKLQTGARNARVQRSGRGYLECAPLVGALDGATGRVDRSMGDIHPGGNPHYLHDPRQALACARGIAGRMAELDPARAAVYRANLDSFERRLAARRAVWERRLAPYRGKPIITYHKSWTYLTSWLGLEEIAYLEPKPGIRPSPTHVAAVIRAGKQRGVKLVLQEIYYPSNTGALVAKQLGARLLAAPGGADLGAGQGYIERMDALVDQLESALRSIS